MILAFVSSVLFLWPLYHLFFSFGLCIICPFLLTFISSVLFLWPLYHLSFSFRKRTDDIKVKRKGPNDTKAKGKGQMMQRPKEKDISFGLCIICPFPLAFVSSGPFLLTFISSVLFLWPLYHLSFSFDLCIICPFPLAFVSSVLSFGLCIGQMIQRPKEKDR
jgi:hypothetical protein